MKTLLVTPKQKKDLDSLLDSKKKIAAIKYIRSLKNGPKSLKDAKHTVDNYVAERAGPGFKTDFTFGYKIVCAPVIKKIVCDFGGGDIEVDLETLEIRVLSELHVLGIDACGKILDLVQSLKDFEEAGCDEDR